MIFLMGGNGFVGQAYRRLFQLRQLPFEIITRENYDSFVGRSCDLFLNANGNSVKFLADRQPVADFDASVRSVVRSLTEIKSKAYIFLSSGDVYSDSTAPAVTREDNVIDLSRSSRYGLHKALAESYVRNTHSRALILRMGGFVGPGMRKNAVFDMLNGEPIWLDLESELTFIGTDTAASIVYSLYEKGVIGETINLGPRGTIKLRDIYTRLRCQSEIKTDARRVRYELNVDRLEVCYGHSLPTTAQEIDSFLAGQGL
ncbi:MAG TPA: NAD(P)-dependent oxidoreductase [Oculatellaceae cyanobacterium]